MQYYVCVTAFSDSQRFSLFERLLQSLTNVPLEKSYSEYLDIYYKTMLRTGSFLTDCMKVFKLKSYGSNNRSNIQILFFIKISYAPSEDGPFWFTLCGFYSGASIWVGFRLLFETSRAKLSQNIRENDGKIVCLRFHWNEISAVK